MPHVIRYASFQGAATMQNAKCAALALCQQTGNSDNAGSLKAERSAAMERRAGTTYVWSKEDSSNVDDNGGDPKRHGETKHKRMSHRHASLWPVRATLAVPGRYIGSLLLSALNFHTCTSTARTMDDQHAKERLGSCGTHARQAASGAWRREAAELR